MPTSRSPTFGGSQDFEAAPSGATFVTLKDALLMLRPQPSPGWRVRPRMSSSNCLGHRSFSAFCRAQASQASWLVTHEWYASSHVPLCPRRAYYASCETFTL